MKTVIDPKEARRFAQFLDERAKYLKSLNAKTSTSLLELKTVWQDIRYQEFIKLFEENTTLLHKFIEHSEKFSNYLRRKAAPVERYLGRRYR